MSDVVIKAGGATLGLDGSMLASLGRYGRALIVPGGGPFADAVRAVDAQYHIGADAAHWAAVLAMDQFAYALAALAHARVITDPTEGVSSDLSILAPYQWLRQTDPLPHSWDVTSDSIAAWVAHAIGVKRLLLVKPIDRADDLVDRYFACVKGDLDVRILAVTALATPPAWHNLSRL